MDKVCENCRFWKSGFAVSGTTLNSCSLPAERPDTIYAARGRGAWLDEGELYTAPTFGCNQFESKIKERVSMDKVRRLYEFLKRPY